MYKHHKESIENMVKHYRENSEIKALFLVGSVATGTERPDSDILKQHRFYCTLKMYYTYFWLSCKPEGYMRHHVADGMIYNLYRLILIENEILFPSMRKLEEYVIRAPNKPERIIEKCHNFMQTLSDEDCLALVESYETWTSYDYPRDHNVVMNNFADPYEWQ